MFKKIDHVEIITSDLERTIRFYMDVLEFNLIQRVAVDSPPLEEVVYLSLNGSVVELMHVTDPVPPSTEEWQVGYHLLALEVDDMDKTLEELKSHGVEPTWGPVNLGTSRRAEIRDPDGLPIELRQW